MKYKDMKVGMKVIVTGSRQKVGVIKSIHSGFYKNHNSLATIKFENGFTEEISARYIKPFEEVGNVNLSGNFYTVNLVRAGGGFTQHTGNLSYDKACEVARSLTMKGHKTMVSFNKPLLEMNAVPVYTCNVEVKMY